MILSGVVVVYKHVGQTPLDCVRDYKKFHPDLLNTTISYAGRLDPMAEGLTLLLIGDENKKRRMYEHLDKEYEVEIIFGIATDTGDLMGKVTQVQRAKSQVHIEVLAKTLQHFEGMQVQRYPVYSSAKVRGKPLYWWARKNQLQEIQIPTHTVNIKSILPLACTSITNRELWEYIQNTIPFVKGDFRQHDIVKAWEHALTPQGVAFSFPVVRIRIACGSGTYMRTLAEDIGQKFDVPTCTLRIQRIRIGDFTSQTK